MLFSMFVFRCKLDVLLRNRLLDTIAAIRWRYWNRLVGKGDELPRENRGFNVVSIFVFLLLAVLIPLDWYLGLTEIALLLLATEGMLLVMYSLCLYRGLYQPGFLVYLAWSYLRIT